MKPDLLALALCACATVPRGSTICVAADAKASIDPPFDPTLQVSTCDDVAQAVALAQKIAQDAGLDWRPLLSLRVRSASTWETITGVPASDVSGTELEGRVETDRCLSSLLHEGFHWRETGATGFIPLDEWLDPHEEWDANGYYPVSFFFAYVWSAARPANRNCRMYAPVTVAQGVKRWHTILPLEVEARLRAAGWAPKLDAWRAEFAGSR